MHAHNRTEADQTDSIAVHATPEEWRKVIDDLVRMDPGDVSPETIELFFLLDRMGSV